MSLPNFNAPLVVDTQEELDRIKAAERIAFGDPDDAAKKTEQAAQLGESYELLRTQHSADIANKIAEEQVAKAMRENPEYASWAKADPQGADMTKDDPETIGFIGSVKGLARTLRHGWRAGRGTAEQGIMWNAAIEQGLRNLTDEEKKRSAEIDEMNSRYSREHEDSWAYDVANLLGTWLGGFQHITPTTTAESTAIGTVVGSAGMYGAGATALATTGAALAPVTAGFSLTAAAAAGMTYAGLKNAYAIEGGLSYKQMLESGMTKQEAFVASRPVALVNAGLEFFPALRAAKRAGKPIIAGVKKAVNTFAARDAALAGRYTWRQIGLDWAKGTVIGGAEETSTEILQEANGILWEELGKRFSSVKDLEKLSVEEIGAQIWDVAKHTWRGASIISAITGMPSVSYGIHRISEAKRDKAFLEQVAATTQGSKLYARSPSHFGSFVAHIAGTGKQTLYIDGRSFHQAVTEAGLTEEQVQAVFGDTGVQQMRHETGDSAVDVEISLQDYAAKVSGTTADPIFQPHVRTDREGYTYAQAVENEVEAAREARRARDGLGDSFRPLSQEEVAALSDRDRKTYEATAARSRVRQRIARSLTNAVERGGLDAKVFTPAQIAWNASMTTRAYEKLAGKLGIPLEDFARRFGADITWETESGVGVADRFDTPVDVQGGVGSLRQILTQARGEAVQGEAAEVTQLRNALNAMPPEQRQSVEALLSAIGDAQPASALAPEAQGLVDRARGGETASAMNAVQALWRAIPQNVRSQIEAALPAEMRTELGNIRNDYRTRDLIRASRMQSAPVNQEESATDNNGNFDPANPSIYQQVNENLEVAPEDSQDRPLEPEIVEFIAGDAEKEAAVRDLLRLMSTAGQQEFVDNLLKNGKIEKQIEYQDAINKAVNAAAQKAGVDLEDGESPVTRALIVRTIVNDALYAINVTPDALGWYDEKVRKCLGFAGAIYPELDPSTSKFDVNKLFAFLYVLAVTSNGQKVADNMRDAVNLYGEYRETGVMPVKKLGIQGEGIEAALRAFPVTMGRFATMDEARKFFMTNWTVSQLNLMGFDAGGESVNETVRGAAILGPKIGNGFFSNLNGMFDALTMDRWFMRTFGRWTGTLIQFEQAKYDKVVQEFKDVVQEIREAHEKGEDNGLADFLKSEFGFDVNGKINDETLARDAASRHQIFMPKVYREEYANKGFGALGEKFRLKNAAIVRNSLRDKVAPAGSGERQYIRSLFGEGLDRLHNIDKTRDLTMADLQAALWYSEKNIYERVHSAKEKTKNKDEAPDYANAMRKIALARGVPKETLEAIERKIDNGILLEQGLKDAVGSVGTRYSSLGNADRSATFRALGFGNLRASRGLPVENGAEQSQRGETAYRARREVADPGLRKPDRGSLGVASASPQLGGGRRHDALLTPVAVWSPGRKVSQVLKENQSIRGRDSSTAAPTFNEYAPTEENARAFLSALQAGKKTVGHAAACVEEKSIEELSGANMRLFLSEDRSSGFALKNGDDIVSVFGTRGKNAGDAVVECAIAAGGRRLDCFNTILPELYAAHGFRPVARIKFNRDYAPSDWNYDYFKEKGYEDPDIVFMVLDDSRNTTYSSSELAQIPYVDDYSDGEKLQAAAVKQYEGNNRTLTNLNLPTQPQRDTVYNQAAAFTPDQSLINAAVENFGITNDPREAGYILPDGRMLDFSGRHWGGGDGGSRIVEHNDISEVEGIEGGGTDAMVEFMARTGAMRVDVNAGIASSAQNPTPEQMGVLSVATRGKPLSLSLITTDGRIVADRELARSNAGSIREFFGQAQGMRDRGQVGNVYAQTAYHGTPNQFDRFDLSHLGEGEGAQAHGWGLYFTGSLDVAQGYWETLTPYANYGYDLTYNGKSYSGEQGWNGIDWRSKPSELAPIWDFVEGELIARIGKEAIGDTDVELSSSRLKDWVNARVSRLEDELKNAKEKQAKQEPRDEDWKYEDDNIAVPIPGALASEKEKKTLLAGNLADFDPDDLGLDGLDEYVSDRQVELLEEQIAALKAVNPDTLNLNISITRKTGGGGRIFEVEIPQEEQFLREHDEMFDQSEFVQSALKNLLEREDLPSDARKVIESALGIGGEQLKSELNREVAEISAELEVLKKRSETLAEDRDKKSSAIAETFVDKFDLSDVGEDFAKELAFAKWRDSPEGKEYESLSQRIQEMESRADLLDDLLLNIDKTPDGERLYDQLETVLGSPKDASKLLLSAGIQGISYYGGRDGQCWVLFDDRQVQITRYWQALGESGAIKLSDRMTLSLETARMMEKNGRKPIDVKIATGWERGYDGKWRYEIPDGKVKPAQSGGGIYGTPEGKHKLGNIYEAEQLYTAYPELRDLDVIIEPSSDPRTTAWFDGNAIHINSNGAFLDRKFKALATARDKAARADEVLTKVNEGFSEEERDDAEERGIRLPTFSQAERAEARARREVDRINADIATQLRYVLVHEVQHWIQDKEGFASGTNAEAMAEAIRNAPEGSRLSSLSPEDAYRFSGGEGESRAMEERLRMSEEERRRTLIIDSFDVAPEDLILMEGKGNSGASSLPRGSFDPRNNTIRLTANANLSTFAHEMGHWYLESLGYFVSNGMADEGLVNDFNSLLSSFGVGSVAEWNALPDARKEVCHERFAAWVEEYLATGDCPVPEAKPILRRFKDWIISVYKDSFLFTGSVHGALSARHKNLFGEDLPALSDEVRQVLDHALMSNAEMAQLEAQQGTPPLFAEKPEGVTDQEWQDYVERMQARTEEGREALAQKNLEKMKWAQAAHSKVLKRVQAAAAKVRKQMEEIARDRVLAPGTLWGKIDAVKRLPRDLRLSEEGLDAYLSADEIAQLKRYRIVAGKGYGIPLSDFCANWGFDDPREFLQSAVVHREAIKLHIEAIADQLMQERYPAYASEKDILNTVAEALAPEVAEAFAANEIAFIERQMAGTAEGNKIAAGRAETVGVEGETFVSLMNALRKAEGEVRQALRDGDDASAATARARRDLLREQVRKLARDSKNVAQTTRVELLDAQNAAELLLGMTPLGRISPTYYLGLAKQSASRALKAMAANDLPTALAEKRNQLVYQVMARRAMQIEKGEIRKVLGIRKSLSQSDEKLGKTRDVDLLNYLRAVLGEFGLQTPNQKESAGAYIERIRAYDPNLAAGLTQMYQRLTANAMPWQSLTYADFQAFAEQVGAVWFLARQSKQIEIDGKKKDIAETREALANQLRKRYAGKSNAHVNSTPTKKDKVWQKVLSLDAGLRRVLSWCRDMDEGNPERPFMRYVYEPVKKGIDTYRTRQREVGKRLTEIYDQYEKTRTKHEGKIVARELMQFDEFGEISNSDPWVFHTKSELIGALLHTGNASNKQKLIGGYRWGAVSTDENGREFVDCSGWDAFIQRMVEEGVLTKADFDFVQAMWDVMESIKPETQTAYHEITGMYFSEITNTPFTVQFPDGTSVTYKGGYAPAKVDPAQVRDHSADEEQALHAINQSYGYPTGGMNFTKNRTEQYREKLLMDIDLVASHVNEALRMAHIEKPARDVFRLFANKKFKSLFNTYGNPFAIDQMLIPWLNRAVNQTVTTAETNAGWKVVSRLLTEVKRRTGLVAMAGNLANALEEVSGFSVALTRVPGAEIRRALLAYNTGKLKAEDVMALSPHMRARLQDSELYALERAEKTFKVEASKLDRASAFCAAHGYVLQQLVQRYVDVPVWWAAYEDAQKKGYSPEEAVQIADEVIDETMSSNTAEGISAIEAGTPLHRALLMFYNYFNMQFNLLHTELGRAVRLGQYGKAAWAFATVCLIPQLISDLFSRLVGSRVGKDIGGDDDDDDDWWIIRALRYFAGQTVQAGFNIAPWLGQAGNWLSDIVSGEEQRFGGQRISMTPTISSIEAAGRLPKDFGRVMDGKGYRTAVRDSLQVISVITGLPLAQPFGRPLGYLADVAEGKTDDGVIDTARGLVSGKSPNRK